ncbi:terminase small subunit [Enterobacter asburiae]|uniref:terminase small subunit n=1 Tax=Enterobacter asburiae TaxID=61645 RepID=UPI00192AAA33|nr:terminase small subunit [Enterobacter asburiae]MBL5914894.1 terminase small subunit [Enterobacter asburiae]MBL5919375.1 terminase small subunit [Enterobacter asburiae]
MNVNKKSLAEIFDVDARTIERWQAQGMPIKSGGGKGVEVLYDTASVIKWYVERDCELENGRLRKELDELRQAGESDLQPGSIDYERYRLTRAQADAQEMKNETERSLLITMELLTFLLPRVASGIASRLDGIPLTLKRKYPELSAVHLDAVKTEVAHASNMAAAIHEDLDRWLDDFNRTRSQ